MEMTVSGTVEDFFHSTPSTPSSVDRLKSGVAGSLGVPDDHVDIMVEAGSVTLKVRVTPPAGVSAHAFAQEISISDNVLSAAQGTGLAVESFVQPIIQVVVVAPPPPSPPQPPPPPAGFPPLGGLPKAPSPRPAVRASPPSVALPSLPLTPQSGGHGLSSTAPDGSQQDELRLALIALGMALPLAIVLICCCLRWRRKRFHSLMLDLSADSPGLNALPALQYSPDARDAPPQACGGHHHTKSPGSAHKASSRFEYVGSGAQHDAAFGIEFTREASNNERRRGQKPSLQSLQSGSKSCAMVSDHL